MSLTVDSPVVLYVSTCTNVYIAHLLMAYMNGRVTGTGLVTPDGMTPPHLC
jgi:hypothetical protein